MKLDELLAQVEFAQKNLAIIRGKMESVFWGGKIHEVKTLAIMAEGNLSHAMYMIEGEIEREREDAMDYQREMENA